MINRLKFKWHNSWKWKVKEQKLNIAFAAVVFGPAALAGWGAYEAGQSYGEHRAAQTSLVVPVSEGRQQILDNNLAGSRQDLKDYLQREANSFKP